MKFDHIGIFVKSLEEGKYHLENIFEIVKCSDQIEDFALKVRVQFFYDSDGVCYELVAPFGDNNPVEPLIKQSKNILNHVAYLVDDMDMKIRELLQRRCILISGPSPAKAFNNRKVAFLYTPLRFVIELIET